jgi:hypothetical protein
VILKGGQSPISIFFHNEMLIVFERKKGLRKVQMEMGPLEAIYSHSKIQRLVHFNLLDMVAEG